jgi:hypothetical protein
MIAAEIADLRDKILRAFKNNTCTTIEAATAEILVGILVQLREITNALELREEIRSKYGRV